MVEWAQWSLSGLPLMVLAAICTHLVVSSSQTLFHYGLGHHRIGGIFCRNHIRFHHTHYAKGHLVSPTYRGAASAASFYAHVYLDKEYHVEGSSLTRFAWFRRKQQLHFVHHLHANSNFAGIDLFWDGL